MLQLSSFCILNHGKPVSRLNPNREESVNFCRQFYTPGIQIESLFSVGRGSLLSGLVLSRCNPRGGVESGALSTIIRIPTVYLPEASLIH